MGKPFWRRPPGRLRLRGWAKGENFFKKFFKKALKYPFDNPRVKIVRATFATWLGVICGKQG